MLSLLIFGLALVASSSALVEAATGYHEEIGIPLAKKIREAEENMSEAVQSRIVGGSVAPEDSHPYFAGLKIDIIGTTDVSVCGSSLLSANRLVTAAHCWYDGKKQAWQFTVNLGSKLFSIGGTQIATTDVITYPKYLPSNLNNDVAMILLPVSVTFSTRIQPIALPSGSDHSDQFIGLWANAVGFGKIYDEQVGVSTFVNHVFLQVIEVQQCQAVYGSSVMVESTLCTSGAGGVGICRGDSGGPLVLNRNDIPTLIGISSFGFNASCQSGFPSGFVRVASFNDFIQQYL